MEGLVTILVFVGVIAVTALIFVIWAIATIIRLFARAFRTLFDVPRPRHSAMTNPLVKRTCPNRQCKAPNPMGARFCRRCGRDLGQIQHVHVSRAAMW